MRILFTSYDHPFAGRSGVSMYCRDVLPALAGRGIEVGSAFIGRRDWGLRPRVRVGQEKGVVLFELCNSPLHPEDSILNPEQDSRQPALEALVRECLERYQPDILHVQSMHGYPASILPMAKTLGPRVIATLHDYWAICSRVFLVRANSEVCDGPDGGRNCLEFCVRRLTLRRKLYRYGSRLPEGRARDAFFFGRNLVRRHAGSSTTLWSEESQPTPAVDSSLAAQHAERPILLTEALNGVDQVLAVSDFVKAVHVRHGVAPSRIRTVHLALAICDSLTWRPRQSPDGEIRFAFLGRAVPLKGAHVYAAAAAGIPEGRARFLLFGPATSDTQRFLQGLAGETPIEFHGPYRRDDLPRILDEVDVVVVPSVAQETVGLVTLEAQAAGVPVIASRVGAIPEFVRDGENGLLFTPGDPSDLREKMLRIIETPSLVAELSRRTHPPMSLAEHVDALVDIYASCLAQDPGR